MEATRKEMGEEKAATVHASTAVRWDIYRASVLLHPSEAAEENLPLAEVVEGGTGARW
jgi:hypothetical protein